MASGLVPRSAARPAARPGTPSVRPLVPESASLDASLRRSHTDSVRIVAFVCARSSETTVPSSDLLRCVRLSLAREARRPATR